MTWPTAQLIELCEFKGGLWKGVKPPFAKAKVLRITNFTKDCELDPSDAIELDVEQRQLEKRTIIDGDIIIEKSGGGPNQPVGRVALCKGLSGTYSFSNFTTALRIKDQQKVQAEYLHKFLKYLYVQGDTEAMQSNSTNLRNLNLDAYKAIQVPLPPLPEQQRIVTKLDAAFAALAEAQAHVERNRANARELFESYLNGVFEGKGDDWPDVRLGDISDRVSVGHVGPTSKYYCSAQEGVPILRSQNVRKGKLDWDGIQYITKDFHRQLKKSRLQRGDLLFVRVGANRGDCCAILEDVGELNCANIVFARPTEGNAAYLEQYCRSTIGRTQLLGMTTGSAQGVINTSSVAELMVPLPSVKEQEAIVARSKEVHHQSQQLEATYQQKLMELEGLKKGLLGAAFRGEL